MRRAILGIIVLCLTFTAGFAFAQRTVTTEFLIDWENVTEEKRQEFIDQFGITPEEMQRQIDSGEANVVASSFGGMDFRIEEAERYLEQQRREEEMHRLILEEIGLSEAEFEQLEINLAGILESYQESEDFPMDLFESLTSDNSGEVAEAMFNQVIFPMVNDVRAEAINFLTEDQYVTLATRLYQFIDLSSDDSIDFDAEIMKTFLLPDLLDLTEEQSAELSQMQKEFITEAMVFEISEQAIIEGLSDEAPYFGNVLPEAATGEERQAIIDQQLAVADKISERHIKQDEFSRKALAKMKTRLDALLTAEQKTKLAQIMQDVPDYLKLALGKQTTESDAAAEPSAAAWRPGANSWVPGMGAPRDLENYPREAPRVREPRGERRFPGSE